MHYQLHLELIWWQEFFGRPITSLLSSLIMQLLGPHENPPRANHYFRKKFGVCSNTWNTLYIIDTFTQIMSRCSCSNPFLSVLDYCSAYVTPILEKSLSHWRQVFFFANWFNHHQPALIYVEPTFLGDVGCGQMQAERGSCIGWCPWCGSGGDEQDVTLA